MNKVLLRLFSGLEFVIRFRLFKAVALVLLGLAAQVVSATLNANDTAAIIDVAEIDDVISPLEGDSTGYITFPVNMPDGSMTDGRFLAMSDIENIYSGLPFEPSTTDAVNDSMIELDNDDSSNLSEGDNGILANLGSAVRFHGLYGSSDYGCPSTLCSFQDTGIGETGDGTEEFPNEHGGGRPDYPFTTDDAIEIDRYISTAGLGNGNPRDIAEYSVNIVPEPASLFLMGLGLVAIGLQWRRSKKTV